MGMAGAKRNGRTRQRVRSAASAGGKPRGTSLAGVESRGGAAAVAPAQSFAAVSSGPPSTAPREAAPEAPSAPGMLPPAWNLESLGDRLAAFGRTSAVRLRRLTVEQWLWIGVIALAFFLRFWNLGAKPLHHDESMHAYFSLLFAQHPETYAYDPLLHGPFQFHAEGFMFALLLALQHIFAAGASGNPWINDTTARFVPALFGVGIVALPFGLRRELGRVGALLCAFLLAVSPSFVYFSRFLREDIYFNFFMFAMVVAALRYAHQRTLWRFILLVAATIFAYATFEGTFLALAVFGSFLAVLCVWDLGPSFARLFPTTFTPRERLFFSRAGALLLLGALGSALALVALGTMNNLNTYITAHVAQADAQVLRLENTTVAALIWLSMLVALAVIGTLVWQMYREDVYYAADEYALALQDADGDKTAIDPQLAARAQRFASVSRIDAVLTAPSRAVARLRAGLDSDGQPFPRLLLGIPWVHWFIAFVVGWLLFAALFWIVPGAHCATIGDCFNTGVGKGIWQGLYYWIQQQHVARGGQPQYYYFLLIPLYEQLVCVFGLAGVAYALARPTRFRLFLVWWFVGSLGLYTWAGEKMPWLSIHILLPLFLLAGIALAWVARQCVATVRALTRDGLAGGLGARWMLGLAASALRTGDDAPGAEEAPAPQLPAWRKLAGVGGAVGFVLLLIPMVYGMYQLSQVHPADGPHEMMVYVQTTPDVDLVMSKIAQADRALYHGQHQLRIGVGRGEEWPFYWYLRDYPNATFSYNAADPKAPPVDVLLLVPANDDYHVDGQTFMALHPTGYHMKEYQLRSWWDESYKPPPCLPSQGKQCDPSSTWGSGVGLSAYLSYGPGAPPNAKFDAGRAASRLWSWLWQRKPLGATDGMSWNFVFITRDGLPIKP